MKNKRVITVVTLILSALIFESWGILTRPKITVKNDALHNSKADASFSSSMDIKNPELLAAGASIDIDTTSGKIAEKQELKLELVGTAIGNIKDPIAFIKDLETGAQGIYKIGDKIKGATIIRITKGEVDLEVNGIKETLRLRKKGTDYATVNSPAIISMDGDSIVMSRNALLNETGNIMGSFSQMKIRPYCESQKVIGMKIEGLNQGSLIAQAGIQNKDVVTAVNNQKIDSYQKALQVFNKVRNQSEIKVTLLRNGETKELNYRVDN